MCLGLGIDPPDDEETLVDLSRECARYVTRRVRSAYPLDTGALAGQRDANTPAGRRNHCLLIATAREVVKLNHLHHPRLLAEPLSSVAAISQR